MGSGNKVDMVVEHANGKDPLVQVVDRGGIFWVEKPSGISSNTPWMVVRHGLPSGHKLGEGDTIKFGRFEFRVKQLVVEKDMQPDLGLQDDSISYCADSSPQDKASRTCRICLM